jgi:hypothetical protein
VLQSLLTIIPAQNMPNNCYLFDSFRFNKIEGYDHFSVLKNIFWRFGRFRAPPDAETCFEPPSHPTRAGVSLRPVTQPHKPRPTYGFLQGVAVDVHQRGGAVTGVVQKAAADQAPCVNATGTVRVAA